ncbi:flagellar filament capping protein FliD [Desulfitobacterium sp. THU1]|uniref:flagellar filament capping protein FliD n=1 Tax=Desulfitobacterium sp. THU1 TaxID=3138072 RepID=UPI00311D4E9D
MSIRTYGLSGSGMDVDQLVKDIMSARREQHDKLWQKKTQLEWKKADYNTMYNSIQTFRNTTAFNYRLSSTTNPKSVVSSSESIITATANSDAANVSHSVDVSQLAQGAKATSTAKITVGDSKDTLVSQFGLTAGTKFNIVLSDRSDGTGAKTIEVDADKSIYDFVSSINNSGLGIKATYDATLDRFNMSTTGSGADVAINFTGTTDSIGVGFIQDKLKLNVFDAGQNAKVKIDGIDFEQSSNTFTAFGVTYNLKSEGIANLNVSADNDKAISAVKDFVEKYNSLLESVEGELKEAKNKSYMPLTDAMKSDLSDSEITKWEDMAKSGLLRNDSTLQSLLYKLRSDVSTPVSGIAGKYNSLASIGVTTGNYTEGGKLNINETKLKEALEADPDIINKLFGSTGEDRNSQGVAVRFYDTLKLSLDSIKETAGIVGTTKGDTESTLARQIKDYEDSLNRMNDRLSQMEERYYKQFDAMEKALSNLSQQSSWLANMFTPSN